VNDYIKINVFKYAACPAGPNGLLKAVAISAGIQDAKPEPILKPNNYPYFVNEEIQHFVLWNETRLEVNASLAILEKHFPPNQNRIILFENPSKHRTIPGVWHCHCFVRTIDGISDEPYARWSPHMNDQGAVNWQLS
jgi:hypothetical protein